MNIDNLNNSQFILLVLLVTLTTSAATALAVLSLVYERTEKSQGSFAQPTIIERTINRIIEREKEVAPQDILLDNDGIAVQPVVRKDITLSDVKNALVQIRLGSQVTGTGIVISPVGAIITSKRLEKERRYSTLNGNTPIYFSVAHSDDHYSLLLPFEYYRPNSYVPVGAAHDVALGQPALLFGGFGGNAQLYNEIVSQTQTRDESHRIRTSATSSDIVLPSAVFVSDVFVGFVTDTSGWVPLVSGDVVRVLNGESPTSDAVLETDITDPSDTPEDFPEQEEGVLESQDDEGADPEDSTEESGLNEGAGDTQDINAIDNTPNQVLYLL